jgi:flagellum-specific peptidoglycan hydrolase FlgJ
VTLDAYLEEGSPSAPPQARVLTEQLDTALTQLADAARARRAPAELPAMPEAQQALVARLGPASPIAHETDRILNSVVLAAHVLEPVDGKMRPVF